CLDLTRQGFRQLARGGDLSLLGALILPDAPACPADDEQNHERQSLGDRPPAYPEASQRALEARWRRRVGETALAQGADAFIENAIGDLEPLALIDAAQALLQVVIAPILLQLAQGNAFLVAERVHHVHREHQLIKRRCRRLSG